MLEGLTRSRETAGQYRRWSAPFRENPQALRALLAANRWLKLLCYVLYPVLLALTWLEAAGSLAAVPAAGPLFWRILATSVGGFVIETAVRALLDAPRPYEALDIEPLIHKRTRGKSFPSRHAFSIFMIATCWMAFEWHVGVALMLAGAVLAWARVICGVHFPRDVVAGALLGVGLGVLGLFVL